MNATVDTVFQEALQLPEELRMSLVERLIVTMSSSEEMEHEHLAIAEARLSEMRDGTVQGVPLGEAIRRVRESLHSKA